MNKMDITNLIANNLLLFHICVIIASLAVVVKSADLLVYSISNYAKKLGVSEYLIGFLVVSIGTSLPELIASITGAMIGQGSIIFGTNLGSNMFKIPLLGLIVLIGKKIKTKQKTIGNAPIITFFMSVLPLVLVVDGYISRVDGVILFIAFIFYIGRLWKDEGKFGEMKKDVKLKNIYTDGIIFIGSLIALLLSARWLVFSSIEISDMLDISPYIVGLVVIGIGASSPEVMVQIRSVLKHHESLAFGNVLGSIVANSTLVIGTSAIIKPFSMAVQPLIVTSLFIFFGVLVTLVITRKEEVNWRHGLVLIGIYVLFLISEFVF